jgi:protein-S-isoprenylcysteine O-methyltransferase Ste14
MSWTAALVLLAYASLLVELVCFPIPSEASAWQLLLRTDGARGEQLLQARAKPLPLRLMLYLLPTVLCVLLFLVPVLAVLWPLLLSRWSVPVPAVVVSAGAVAVIVGRLLTFVSVLQLRARRRHAGAPLGLFGWSRNPGLLGMFLFFAGLCALVGVPLLWLGMPVYLGNMHARVRLEESQLVAIGGEAWREYAARVPRYLPLPWLR